MSMSRSRDSEIRKARAEAALGLRRPALAGALIALEPRMVFDGAMAATAETVLKTTSMDAPHADGAAADAHIGEPGGAWPVAGSLPRVAPEAARTPTPPPSAVELVVLDARVAEAGAFADLAGPGKFVVTIGTTTDGIAAIGDVLDSLGAPVSAIHVVSHGREGAFTLGDRDIDVKALQRDGSLLSHWRPHLAAGADILLYGCDTGAGTDGTALMNALARETGADVAASTDATGGGTGANWILERSTGSVEARLLAPVDWWHDLADVTNPTARPTQADASAQLGGVDTSALKVWMDASKLTGAAGDTVRQWTNLASGIGGVADPTLETPAGTTVPTLGSDDKGAFVQFTQSGRFSFGTQPWFNGESTIFLVMEADDLPTGSPIYQPFGARNSNGNNILVWGSSIAASQWSQGSNTTQLVLSADRTKDQVVSARFTGGGDNWTMGGRSTLSASGTVAVEAGFNSIDNDGVLALANWGRSTSYFNGRIREAVVFSRALGDAEMRSVEAALATRWNLTGSLFAPTTVTGAGTRDAAVVSRSDRTAFTTASAGGLTVDAGNFMADAGNSVAWANDGKTLGFTADAGLGAQRTDRVWTVDVTGTSGTARLTFSGLTLPPGTDPSTLRLVWRAGSNAPWTLLSAGAPFVSTSVDGTSVSFDGVLVGDSGVTGFTQTLRDGQVSVAALPDALVVGLREDTGTSATDLRTVDGKDTVVIKSVDTTRYDILIRVPGGAQAPLTLFDSVGGDVLFNGHVDASRPRQMFTLQLRDKATGALVGRETPFSFMLDPNGAFDFEVVAPPATLNALAPSPPQTVVTGTVVAVNEIVGNSRTISELRIAQVVAPAVRGPFTYSIVSQSIAGHYAIDASSGWITVAKGQTTDAETTSTAGETVRIRVDNGLTAVERDYTIRLRDRNDGPVLSVSTVNMAKAYNSSYGGTAYNGSLFMNEKEPLAFLSGEDYASRLAAGTLGTSPTMVLTLVDEDLDGARALDTFAGTLSLSAGAYRGTGGVFNADPAAMSRLGLFVSGNGTSALTVTGKLSAIKQGLASIGFARSEGMTAANIYVSYADLGNARSGGDNLGTATVQTLVYVRNILTTLPQDNYEASISQSGLTQPTNGVMGVTIANTVMRTDTEVGAFSIAITAVPPPSVGTWWYSGSGTSWVAITSATPASALVLPSTYMLYFQAASTPTDRSGALTFRVLDQSGVDFQAYAAQSRIDISNALVRTVLAAETGTIAAWLNSRPEANATALLSHPLLTTEPVVNQLSSTVNGGTLVGTGATGVTALDLYAQVFKSDPDAPAARVLALTGLDAAGGTWWVTIDNARSWVRISSVAANTAILFSVSDQVRFYYQAPAGVAAHAASLTLRAGDPQGQGGAPVNFAASAISNGAFVAANVATLGEGPASPWSAPVTTRFAVSTRPTVAAGTTATLAVPQQGGDKSGLKGDGVTVAQILAAFPAGSVTGAQGIVITPPSGSTLYFSLNGGLSWSQTRAPLFMRDFGDATRIRILPSSAAVTSITASVNAWDGTVLDQGTYATAPTATQPDALKAIYALAASSAMSANTASLTLTSRMYANEKPVLDLSKQFDPTASSDPLVNPANAALLAGRFALVDQQQTFTLATSVLGRTVSEIMVSSATFIDTTGKGSSFADPDSAAGTMGMAIVGTAAGGTLYWRDSTYAAWQKVTKAVSPTDALLLGRGAQVTWVPDRPASGLLPVQVISGAISIKAWDAAWAGIDASGAAVSWASGSTTARGEVRFDTTKVLSVNPATTFAPTAAQTVGAFSDQTAAMTLNIVADNTAAKVTGSANETVFTEPVVPANAAASTAGITLFKGVAVTMGDNSAVENANQRVTDFSLRVTPGTGAPLTADDVLRIDGADVRLANGQSATSNLGVVFTVSASADGVATVTANAQAFSLVQTSFQTMLSGIQYRNTGNDPTAGQPDITRTIALASVKDFDPGSGIATTQSTAANLIATTITVRGVADVPVLGVASGGTTATEQAGSIQVFPKATPGEADGAGVTDPDSQFVRKAEITLTSSDPAGSPLGAGDAMALSGVPSSIVVQWSGDGRTVTLLPVNAAGEGIRLADMSTALRLLTYGYSGDARVADRVVTLKLYDSTSTDGAPLFSTTTRTIAVANVSDAPAAVASSVTTAEDTTYVFKAADFPFTDPDGTGTRQDALAAVVVRTLPARGELRLLGDQNGFTSQPVTAGMSVTRAQLDAGLLRYTPALNLNGTAGAASFAFSVRDSGADGGQAYDGGATATLSIAVTSLDDAPVTADARVAIAENGSHAFRTSDFAFDDPDDAVVNGGTPNAPVAVVITALPASSRGALAYNGATLTTLPTGGLRILVADIPNLTWTPARGTANWSGTGPLPDSPFASFSFRFEDSGGSTGGNANLSVARTFAFDVANVPDKPVVTAGSASLTDKAMLPFSAATADSVFGFSDPADASQGFGNALNSVIVTGLPEHGQLLFDGVALTAADLGPAGKEIALAEIGRLSFRPAADFAFDATDSFRYRLRDTGAPSGEGANLSDEAIFAISLTAVNDAPVLGGVTTIAYTENDPATAILPGLTLDDVDNTTLSGATVRITAGLAAAEDILDWTPALGSAITRTWDASTGTLTLSGNASLAAYRDALRAVTYRNTSDNPSTTPRSITVTVTDAGLAGVGSQSTAASTTLAVTAVNDAPTARDDSGISAVSGFETVIRASDLLANDLDAETPTSALVLDDVRNAVNGTVSRNDQTITFTPTPGLTGAASFQYRTRDPQGLTSAWATVTLAVTNGRLTVQADSASMDENARVWRSAAAGVLENDGSDPKGPVEVTRARLGTAAEFVEITTTGTTLVGTYGTLTIARDGSFTYVANRADALRRGEIVTETFVYEGRNLSLVTDTTTLSFTITGLDDTATITGTDAGSVTEAGGSDNATSGIRTASGTLVVRDPDSGESGFRPIAPSALSGTYGTFTFNETTGAWSYTLDEAKADVVRGGNKATDSLLVTSLDGSAVETIVIDITGANDTPVLAAIRQPDAVTEAANASAQRVNPTGRLWVADRDSGDTLTPNAGAPAIGLNGKTPASGAIPADVLQTLQAARLVFATAVSDGTSKGIAWSFDRTLALDWLKGGDTLTLSYDVTVSDGSDTTEARTLVVTITGTNDAPSATADRLTQIVTGGLDTVIAAADLLGNDTDLDQSAGTALTVGAVRITAGESKIESVSLDAQGRVILRPVAGYTGTASFEYQAKDENGLAGNWTTVTVDVVAFYVTDDSATVQENASVQVAAGGVLANDGANASVTRVRAGTAGDWIDLPASGTARLVSDYGTLTLSRDGAYTYEANGVGVDRLPGGARQNDVFSYEAANPAGASAVASLTVTVTGVNDAPVLDTLAQPNAVTEDTDASAQVIRLAGSLTVGDRDAGNTLTPSAGAPTILLNGAAPAPGVIPAAVLQALQDARLSFTAAPLSDGEPKSIRWTFDTTIALDWLNGTDTLALRYDVAVSDGTVATEGQALVITIAGTNDVATIGDARDTTVTEDTLVSPTGRLSTTGTLDIADKDRAEAAFSTTVKAATATLGTLSITPGGAYTYSIDNAAVQALAAGDTRVETFTVQSVDGTEKQLRFTVRGTNDVPVVATTDVTGAVEEAGTPAGSLTDSGTIAFTDVDLTDVHSVGAVTASTGALGALTARVGTDTTGTGTGGVVTWTYTVPASAVEYLARGQTKVETFTFDVSDGQGGSVTRTVAVTITGTNDAPVVATADVTGAVNEMGTPSGTIADTGTIAFSDVDLTDVHSVGTVTASTGALGSLTARVGTDTTGTGTGGVVTWTYTVPASAVEYLAKGQTKVETFTFDIADGQGGSVTRTVAVTITGTNDAPVVATADVTGAVEEAGTPTGSLTDTGTIAFADVDLTDAHAVGAITASAGALGSLVASVGRDTTGTGTGGVVTWTYTVPASAVEYLARGQTKVETFTFDVSDGQGGSVTRTVEVTITGTNDAPVVATADVTGAVTEMGTPSGTIADTGTIAFSDVDLTDVHSVGTVTASAGALGSLTARVGTDTTGTGAGGVVTWTYTVPASAVESLARGQTKVETFTFDIADGQGGSVTRTVEVTITGTNDAAVIGAPDNPTVREDIGMDSSGRLTTRGQLAISDVDLGEASFSTVVEPEAGTIGRLEIDAAGNYTYGIDNARVQSLGAGQSLVEAFTVRSFDGTSMVIRFTVEGANDTPTGSLTISGAAFPGETLQATQNLSDAEGLGDVTIVWQRNGVDIPGAIGPRYTLVGEDVDTAITAVVRYTDGSGMPESFTSSAVRPQPVPIVPSSSTLSGVPTVPGTQGFQGAQGLSVLETVTTAGSSEAGDRPGPFARDVSGTPEPAINVMVTTSRGDVLGPGVTGAAGLDLSRDRIQYMSRLRTTYVEINISATDGKSQAITVGAESDLTVTHPDGSAIVGMFVSASGAILLPRALSSDEILITFRLPDGTLVRQMLRVDLGHGGLDLVWDNTEAAPPPTFMQQLAKLAAEAAGWKITLN